jgi:hypothetical protein
MRALALLAFVTACAPGTTDFIEVHGKFPDGSILAVHAQAQTLPGPGAQPQLGNVIALTSGPMGPEDLRALRLEWMPGKITVGTAQPSQPNGPVIFYVGTSIPDAGMFDSKLHVVNGGAVTFTQNTAKATGTIANMILMRLDATGVERTLLTIDNGTFSATNP